MLREYLSNIADKFRTYLDTTEPINAQDFAGKVEDVAVRYNQLGFTSGYNQGLEEGIEQGKPLGKLELLQDSEYMNAKVSGTAIAVNDVSPIEHSVGCNVASKNMFDISKVKTTQNAIINNGDGSLTIKAWATTATSPNALKDYCPRLRVGDTATLSCNSTATLVDGTYTEHIESIYLLGVNKYWKNGTSMSLTQEILDSKVYFYCSKIDGVFSDATWSNIQVELGTTATAYTPYVADVGGIEVSRYGKNLFDQDTVLPNLPNPYGDGWKWKKQEDGSFYCGNTGTFERSVWFENTANYKGQMFMSVTSKYKRTEVGGYGLSLVIGYTDGTRISLMTPITLEYSVTVVVTDANKTVSNIWQTYNSGEAVYVKDVMIAYGSDTSYEPYIEPTTYQSTADGIVKGVTSISPNMTLLTNNNGVVVNANYLRDIDTYIDNLITNVALTGGE